MKLIYWYVNDCSVCGADEAKVEQLARHYGVAFEKHDISAELAEASQQLIFAVPTITLMDGKKELHRQARIIDFLLLEKHLERIRYADH